MASMATETKSPTATSTSPLSFLNSSTGTYASDLSPALTTTKLCSMRTTSAVMTSPARISERVSDSSKRAAKDSDIQVPCTFAKGSGGHHCLHVSVPAPAGCEDLGRRSHAAWGRGWLTIRTTGALLRERGGAGLAGGPLGPPFLASGRRERL